MSDLTVEEFVRVVQRSQLVDKAELLDALSECPSDHESSDGARGIADYLEARGLVTEWQKKNLLQGKSRGFFLGQYRLLGHLGTGGMSSVFLARHGLMDRMVAIKVLPTSKESDPTFVNRFEREALATSKLSHPNVVRVFDIDTQGKTHYIVMEYVSGKDLKAIVEEQGPLPLETAANYVAQAAAGLQHAHERGLVHRDIKPANLVVNDNGLLKVLDLGLARLEDEEANASLTSNNSESMMGTADYLSPEQARNAHSVDHRADIYSLGCTFFYLLTGRAPFTEGTIAERILKHQTERPTDVRAEREDCPHALADVCMTMLEKDPDQRFESCGKVVQRLVRWLMAKGHPTTSSISGFVSDVVDVPALTEVSPADDFEQELPIAEQESLLKARKSRSTSPPRTPIGLWIFLVVSVIVCLVLFAVVLLR